MNKSDLPSFELKKIIVTVEITYTVPFSGDVSEINGWGLQEVADDWFFKTPLWMSHATRDAYRVGHSEKLVGIRLEDGVRIDPKEIHHTESGGKPSDFQRETRSKRIQPGENNE